MLFATLLAILALPLTVLAGLQLDYADVPAACVSTCRAIAELSGICDVDADFDDNNEEVEDLMKLQCMCTNRSFDVPAATALCASCIEQNGMPSDRDDNLDDISEIVARCGFQNMTWTPWVGRAMPGVVGVRVVATRLRSPAQITDAVDFAPPPPKAAAPGSTPGKEGQEQDQGGQSRVERRQKPKEHNWKHVWW